MMRRLKQLILWTFLTLILGGTVFAQTPATSEGAPVLYNIAYQGRLTNAQGEPITTSSSVTFAIYSQASGGTALWQEHYPSLGFQGGFFTVSLGSRTALDYRILSTYPLYLGISVDGAAELSPRTEFHAVPYSVQARNAQLLGGLPASDYVTQARLDEDNTADVLAIVQNNPLSQLTVTGTFTASVNAASIEGILQPQHGGTGVNSLTALYSALPIDTNRDRAIAVASASLTEAFQTADQALGQQIRGIQTQFQQADTLLYQELTSSFNRAISASETRQQQTTDTAIQQANAQQDQALISSFNRAISASETRQQQATDTAIQQANAQQDQALISSFNRAISDSETRQQQAADTAIQQANAQQDQALISSFNRAISASETRQQQAADTAIQQANAQQDQALISSFNRAISASETRQQQATDTAIQQANAQQDQALTSSFNRAISASETRQQQATDTAIQQANAQQDQALTSSFNRAISASETRQQQYTDQAISDAVTSSNREISAVRTELSSEFQSADRRLEASLLSAIPPMITSTNLIGVIPVNKGGTGVQSMEALRSALQLTTTAQQSDLQALARELNTSFNTRLSDTQDSIETAYTQAIAEAITNVSANLTASTNRAIQASEARTQTAYEQADATLRDAVLAEIPSFVTSENFTGVLPVSKGGTGVTSLDELVLDHPSINAAQSTDLTGNKVIQNIQLDSNGHVTQIRSVDLSRLAAQQPRMFMQSLSSVSSSSSDSDLVSEVGFNDGVVANPSNWTDMSSAPDPAFASPPKKTSAIGESIDFAVPTNAMTAYISLNTQPDGGFITVELLQGAVYRFHRIIDTRQLFADRISENNGPIAVLAATELNGSTGYSRIRFTNQAGTFRFTGVRFSSLIVGGQDSGYTSWDNVYDKPLEFTDNNLLITTQGGSGTPGSRLSVSGNTSIGSSFAALAAPTDGLLVQGTTLIATTNGTGLIFNANGNARLGKLGIGKSPAGSSLLDINGNINLNGNTIENLSSVNLPRFTIAPGSAANQLAITTTQNTPQLRLFDRSTLANTSTGISLTLEGSGITNTKALALNNNDITLSTNGAPRLQLLADGSFIFNNTRTTSRAQYEFYQPEVPGSSLPLMLLNSERADDGFVSRIYDGFQGDWVIQSGTQAGNIGLQGLGGSVTIGAGDSALSTLNVQANSLFTKTARFNSTVFVGTTNLNDFIAGGGGGSSSTINFNNGATLQSGPSDADLVDLTWNSDNEASGFRLVHRKSPDGSWLSRPRTFGSLVASGGQNLQFGLQDGSNNWVFRSNPNYTFTPIGAGAPTIQRAETSLFVNSQESLRFSIDSATGLLEAAFLTDRMTLTHPANSNVYAFRVDSSGVLNIRTTASSSSEGVLINELQVGSTGKGLNFVGSPGTPTRGISFQGAPALTAAANHGTLFLNKNFNYGFVNIGNALDSDSRSTVLTVFGDTVTSKLYDIVPGSQGTRDTTYFVDPNSNSNLSTLSVANNATIGGHTQTSTLQSTTITSNTTYSDTIRTNLIVDAEQPYYRIEPNRRAIIKEFVGFKYYDLNDVGPTQVYQVDPSDLTRLNKVVIQNKTTSYPATVYSNWQLTVIAPDNNSGAIRAISNTLPRTSGGQTYDLATIYAHNKSSADSADFMSENGTYLSRSSRRWKSDIRTIPNALDTILKLDGVMYTNHSANIPKENDIGFIAEDLGKVLPSLVIYEANKKDAIGLFYDKIGPILVEALKEEHQHVLQLQDRVSKLEKRLLELEQRFSEK